MKRLPVIAILGVMLSVSRPAAAGVNAWLDHNQVGPGETVQLTLQHDGQTSSQPDLSPLQKDFDILARSSGSSIQIVNGSVSSRAQITLSLSPRHSGSLVIPPLTWDGGRTPALQLVVSGGSASGAGAGATGERDVFITTTIEQPQPYVQAADTLAVRLYTDEPIYQASLDLEAGHDVLVQRIGKDTHSDVVRDGHTYQVIERRYLLFPQRSGEIRIDGPVFDAQVPDRRSGFFGNDPLASMLGSTRPVRLHGEPIILRVRPRPAAWTGGDWLPARQVSLQENWQPDSGPIHVGDPLTWHLHLEALGLTAGQLTDLSRLITLPPGIRAYPDQPKLSTDVQGDTVNGKRDQDIALIASQPGHFQIPALHLSWWDTTRDAQQEIDLPARTIEILPASASATGIAAQSTLPAASAPPVAPAAAGSSPGARNVWPWVALALGILWLGSLAGWWISSRRRRGSPSPVKEPVREARAKTPDESALRHAFQHACQLEDAPAARRHLLEWARAVWPENPPAGLNALADRIDDADLPALLRELDRACYAGAGWRGPQLSEKLTSLKRADAGTARPERGLAGLYP